MREEEGSNIMSEWTRLLNDLGKIYIHEDQENCTGQCIGFKRDWSFEKSVFSSFKVR